MCVYLSVCVRGRERWWGGGESECKCNSKILCVSVSRRKGLREGGKIKNDVRVQRDGRRRVMMQRVESAGKLITDWRRVRSQTQWRNRTERFLNQPKDSSYTQYTSTKNQRGGGKIRAFRRHRERQTEKRECQRECQTQRFKGYKWWQSERDEWMWGNDCTRSVEEE